MSGDPLTIGLRRDPERPGEYVVRGAIGRVWRQPDGWAASDKRGRLIALNLPTRGRAVEFVVER